METTETIENKPLNIEEAVAGILATPTDETTETVEDNIQATEEETIEVSDENTNVEEISAETEVEDDVELDDTDAEEIEASDVDDDNDYEEDAVQEEVSDTYEVKVDGQVKEVTLDELKQGYSGQEYVQKGMQENAMMRKQVEEVFSALQSERQEVAKILQQMQSGNIAQEPTPPSREDFKNDPVGFMELQMEYQEQKAEYDKQMAQVQKITQEQSQAEQVAHQAYLKQEMDKLAKAIPEFADPQKVATVKNKLVNGASKYFGYTAEEVGLVADSRALIVLKRAIDYMDLTTNKTKAKKTTNKRVVKAGAKKVSDGNNKVRQKQMAKLKQSGNLNDAISLMFK